MRKELLPFMNLTDLRRKQGDLTLDGDEVDGYRVFMNSLFTPVDMTDYED